MKPLGLLLITLAAMFTACRHTSSEGPETSPVGPPVLSKAAIGQALSEVATGTVDPEAAMATLQAAAEAL